MNHPLELIIEKYRHQFQKVVPFNAATDKLRKMDMADKNLTSDVFHSTEKFTKYVDNLLAADGARYGVGGYLENREIYARSDVFGSNPANARTIHLGIDIWGPAGTPIFAPWGGSIHSFAYNAQFGDYGATIILQHQIDGFYFHTLYGHVSLADLAIGQNQYISIGEKFAHFGQPHENGQWPPHLHFQIIMDMELKQGDYPGVCRLADIEYYRNNCPDPAMLLNFH